MPTLPHPDSDIFSNAPAHPVRLGHYQLRQCLGEGGFGQVFEAWDPQLLRPVAIKCLKNTGSPEQSGSLLREARLAAALKHPAFVKIHGMEQGEDDSQAIVMELVEGQTLKQLLAGQALVEAAAVDIVRQVAQAMQAAHSAGMVHGDLKPSNLMQEPGGQIRILDLGLARQTDLAATTSVSQLDPQGTLAYMAPERLLGAPLTPLSDVYALGVILYELLCGQRPQADLQGLALAVAQVRVTCVQWPWPDAISLACKELIMAMTAKVPGQRLQEMGAVLERLTLLPDKLPTIATTNSVETPVAIGAPYPSRANFAWLRTHKRTRLAAAAFMVCLVLAGVAMKYWPDIQQLPAFPLPFSEARELNHGLAALKLFDRPGSLDNATKSFERILTQNPKNAAAIAGLALVYSYRYQSDERDQTWLEKADVAAQQALMLNDHLALSHIATGFVLIQRGKLALALDANERALKLEPMNFFAWNGKLSALLFLGRNEDAQKFGELAMQRFPQERIFIDELGRFYIEQGKFNLAEQFLRRSIALQPDAVYAYAMLAGALLHQNKQDEALQVLQQGLQIRPSGMLYGNLGNILFARGDYLAAARAFENAVSPDKGNPVDYLGWANLADTLLWIPGRADEAKRAYGKARKLLAPILMRQKNDATLVSRMGLYAARTGNKAEAQTLMSQAVKLAPGLAFVHFRAGLAYELLGERKLALTAIAKAKSLGYPAKSIEAEPDLVALRRDPGYF